MEHNVIDDYIKCEIDLEAVSTLLNKVYDKEKDSLQSHANYKSHIGKMMYEKEEERFSCFPQRGDPKMVLGLHPDSIQ